MRKRDLSGMRFGRLMVLEAAPNIHGSSRPSGRCAWRCLCDCGKHSVAASDSLMSGATSSCGCLQTEASRRKCMNRRITDPVKIRQNHVRHKRLQFYGNMRRKFGITPECYDTMVIQQAGRCAICDEVKDLGVDHCHFSGKIRGLLCSNCNYAIGLLKDKPVVLERAAQYLRNHGGANE